MKILWYERLSQHILVPLACWLAMEEGCTSVVLGIEVVTKSVHLRAYESIFRFSERLNLVRRYPFEVCA